jgi:hypothetical protein
VLPNSSLTPYIQPSDVLARSDWRVIAQLVNDNPGTATAPTPILEADLPTNLNFLTIINGACGRLESACLRSQIYAVSDLQALNGMSQQYMFDILTALIIYTCYTRRSGPAMSETVINNYNFAMGELNALSDGSKIFAFQQTEQSGVPTTYQQSWADYAISQNLLTIKYNRYFGTRNNVTRYGGGGWGGGF